MNKFNKTIIIKIIGILISAFLVATSFFFYFDAKYKLDYAGVVLLFVTGAAIFIMSMNYEVETETE